MAQRWKAALALGLISGSYSTLVSQLTAARIGRDAQVDWMVVGNIPMRDQALHIVPQASTIFAGIAFHQWADFSWAVFFFGVIGFWTARLSPASLALLAAPWALVTSSLEWLILVPLAPFFQPIFPLEQPYWIGFLVHLTSALIYPLFPLLRAWISGGARSANSHFALAWAAALATGLALVCVLSVLGSRGYELPWMGNDEIIDQAYMRRMTAHHAQGIIVATIAADKASSDHLRALARLMAAEQQGENSILNQWSRSWFLGPPQACNADELVNMPGMLTDAELEELRQAEGLSFDILFVKLMSFHHMGAARMADVELRSGGDIRLRLMAHGIRHAQQGEIALMNGVRGLAAVRKAILNQFVLSEPAQQLKH
jgi:uncharacterized protein (DUF305 family)